MGLLLVGLSSFIIHQSNYYLTNDTWLNTYTDIVLGGAAFLLFVRLCLCPTKFKHLWILDMWTWVKKESLLWWSLLVFSLAIFSIWFVAESNGFYDKDGMSNQWLENILVEAHGMIGDIIVFGIILTVLNSIYSRKQNLQRYNEEIEDFRGWEEKEAVYRISGNVRRINKLGAVPQNMRGAYLAGSDLRGANLAGVDLVGADLSDSDCGTANFSKTNFLGASFVDAELSEVNLAEANMMNANLKNAFVIETDLGNTNLKGANFENAKVFYTDFSGARLRAARFVDVDISQAKGITENQLSQAMICRVKLPDGINLDPNRDCAKLDIDPETGEEIVAHS